ncbi:MAG: nucleotidyltransferase domain-containing protein [Ginsengibacter sp.]
MCAQNSLFIQTYEFRVVLVLAVTFYTRSIMEFSNKGKAQPIVEIMFPTQLHRAAVNVIKGVFLGKQHVDSVLLVNSLARGKATADSDIDICILVDEATSNEEIAMLENTWNNTLSSDQTLKQFKTSHQFAGIHLDIIDGVFNPSPWENGGGVDFFEIEIGNRISYSLPLTTEGEHFRKLKMKWLPYYNAVLQSERLRLAKENCLYELDHIPFFTKRGLYFQAFDRLYIAFQKFLMALFIKYQTYPIAYNKWIKEQVVEILGQPELFTELPKIISVTNIESIEVDNNAKALKQLLEDYC